MMATLGPCEVVHEHCTAPPSLTGYTRGICFACGLRACPACSVRMQYLRYGVQRIGFNCILIGMPFKGPEDRAEGRAYVARILKRRGRT